MDAALVERLKHEVFGIGVDSYTRIEVALDHFLRHGENRLECFASLGHAWSSCEDLSEYMRHWLRPLLSQASREELDAMMTADEHAAWAALPPMLTVYRGCGWTNVDGMSWSLSREIAEGFPFLNRYRVEHPPVVTGRVSKARVALKLDRGEQEVIAARVRRVRIERITDVRAAT